MDIILRKIPAIMAAIFTFAVSSILFLFILQVCVSQSVKSVCVDLSVTALVVVLVGLGKFVINGWEATVLNLVAETVLVTLMGVEDYALGVGFPGEFASF